MRLKRLAQANGVVLMAAATVAVATASPASAESTTLNGSWFGSIGKDNQFIWALRSTLFEYGNPRTPPNFTSAGGQLYLGRNAVVSATNCKITLWLTLDKIRSDTWESPKVTQGCMNVINTRDTIHYFFTPTWDTSGTAAVAHMCVYLYYNNSSSYGWHRCEVGVWTYP